MMKPTIFCLLLLFSVNIAAAEYTITVNTSQNGDADWLIEKYNKLDEAGFNEWITVGQNISKYKNFTEFEMIKQLEISATNFSNRSMKIENVNITYDSKKTLSGGLGIIKYTFLWKNFSYMDSEKIYIGDAIPENVPLLSPENQLIIRIPEGYNVTNATPAYDKMNGNILIWDSTLYNNFSRGGPFIELSQSNATNMTGSQNVNESWLEKWHVKEIIIISVIILALVAFIRFWKKKRSENVPTTKMKFYEDMLTEVPKEMIHEISEIPEAWTKIVQKVQDELGNESVEELEKAAREQRLKNMGLDPNIPLSEFAKEDLEDEEMIKQFILRSGGQAYQSDIVEHSGLSKSKISMVLSKMKDDGMIIKIRKGKENLIRLVK